VGIPLKGAFIKIHSGHLRSNWSRIFESILTFLAEQFRYWEAFPSGRAIGGAPDYRSKVLCGGGSFRFRGASVLFVSLDTIGFTLSRVGID